jgi:hypothetical protein
MSHYLSDYYKKLYIVMICIIYNMYYRSSPWKINRYRNYWIIIGSLRVVRSVLFCPQWVVVVSFFKVKPRLCGNNFSTKMLLKVLSSHILDYSIVPNLATRNEPIIINFDSQLVLAYKKILFSEVMRGKNWECSKYKTVKDMIYKISNIFVFYQLVSILY